MASFHRTDCVFALLLGFGPAALTQELPADLDAYVSRTMTMFQVPGIAVAVVKDGRVVVAKRAQGRPARKGG